MRRYVTPDSTVPIPTEFWQDIDRDKVEKVYNMTFETFPPEVQSFFLRLAEVKPALLKYTGDTLGLEGAFAEFE